MLVIVKGALKGLGIAFLIFLPFGSLLRNGPLESLIFYGFPLAGGLWAHFAEKERKEKLRREVKHEEVKRQFEQRETEIKREQERKEAEVRRERERIQQAERQQQRAEELEAMKESFRRMTFAKLTFEHEKRERDILGIRADLRHEDQEHSQFISDPENAGCSTPAWEHHHRVCDRLNSEIRAIEEELKLIQEAMEYAS